MFRKRNATARNNTNSIRRTPIVDESSRTRDPNHVEDKDTSKSKDEDTEGTTNTCESSDSEQKISLREVMQKRRSNVRANGVDVELLASASTKRIPIAEPQDALKPGRSEQDTPISHIRGAAFAAESGAVDTCRLMNRFVEEKLASKFGKPSDTLDNDEEDTQDDINKKSKQVLVLDSMDFLANRIQQPESTSGKNRTANDDDDDDSEGNITFSASMLGSVPEVDLGSQSKLRNIALTEEAQRRMKSGARKRGADRNQTASDIKAIDRFRKQLRK